MQDAPLPHLPVMAFYSSIDLLYFSKNIRQVFIHYFLNNFKINPSAILNYSIF